MKSNDKINFITLWKLNDWGFYNRRDEALLWELSRRDNVESVLHIEHIGIKGLIYRIKQWLTTKDRAFRRAYSYHIRKGLSIRPIPVNKEKKYYIYSVVILFPKNNPFLRKLSDFFVKIQYCAINKNFINKKKNVVLVAYPPSKYLLDAIRSVKHDILIADFEDDVLERTDDPDRKRQIENNYKNILPRCRWIFSTSPEMDRKYREYAKQEIHYLPNGVDINLFLANRKSLNKSDRKVVGYVGRINKTMDADLLEYTVSHYPQVDFIIIGRMVKEQLKDINKLTLKYSNFYYLGEKNFVDATRYIKEIDVLISFKKNDHTTVGNDSQKIYEYLATGNPVVTTPVAPADRFRDLIYVAHDKFQFVEFLKKALEEDDVELREKRVKAAADNSWGKRADVILSKVSEFF